MKHKSDNSPLLVLLYQTPVLFKLEPLTKDNRYIWRGSICSLLDGAQTTSATFMKRSYQGLADVLEVRPGKTNRLDLLFAGS